MSDIVKRGFVPSDEKEFGVAAMEKLHKAGADLYYLINQGYPIKPASTFVGNHYMLSERQRLALVRSISPKKQIAARCAKEITGDLTGLEVNIDGFNTIITLEVAFSGSTLLKCMDGCVRDLAGLRGTYRLIDKTDMAIRAMGKVLAAGKVAKANIYLDAPVSNSGRLKARIAELLADYDFELEFYIINGVDSALEVLPNVITGDAIILDKCKSWFNLTKVAIEQEIGEYPFVEI